ncbi:MAG: histidine kinase, partial [Burkholderiaceae bacterium]
MFELAPVSLWLEDYSGLHAMFERWRAAGITDLRRYLKEEPARLLECSRQLKVLQVNRRTLELFGARDQAHLLANLDQVFRDAMLTAYTDELVALWEGRLRFSSQSVNYSLSGKRLEIIVNGSVLPGHESNWARVLVAIENVTERTLAERQLARSERYAHGLFQDSPVSLWVEDF